MPQAGQPWRRACRGGGLGPLGAGQTGLRDARRAGIKSTMGRLRQLDPEGEQLFPRGGGRGKGPGTPRVGPVARLLRLSEGHLRASDVGYSRPRW